jgi:biofilm PGA synthesis N-glycosyltransferase PgaC
VWRGGWRARLLGLSLFPELGYAMFLNLVYIKGVWDLSLSRQATWTHVVQADRGTAVEA